MVSIIAQFYLKFEFFGLSSKAIDYSFTKWGKYLLLKPNKMWFSLFKILLNKSYLITKNWKNSTRECIFNGDFKLALYGRKKGILRYSCSRLLRVTTTGLRT